MKLESIKNITDRNSHKNTSNDENEYIEPPEVLAIWMRIFERV